MPLRGQSRRGSVLLFVMALLLLLMLVGFTFLTFSSQESVSAQYYAEAAKQDGETAMDPDIFWDYVLEQYIIGPKETNYQSVLWPGRFALVPNAIGMFGANLTVDSTGQTFPVDTQLHNGIGLNIVMDNTGQPWVDQNYDGVADAQSSLLLQINFSQLYAMNQTGPNAYTRANLLNPALAGPGFPQFPSIDAGYTYPDINSLFLAHVSPGNEYAGATRVVTPSFVGPQYLRIGGVPIANWQAQQGALSTAKYVLRPHPEHVNVADNTVRRFLSTAITVPPANIRTIQPFQFQTDADGDGPTLGKYGEMGVWSGPGTGANETELDVDNDNDGILDSIWTDLNFPAITLTDGRLAMPLFSAMILAADGLVNLNTSGNLAAMHALNPATGNLQYPDITSAIASGLPISRSNMGLSVSEINPFWCLTADPVSALYFSPADSNPSTSPSTISPAQQYRGFLGLSNQSGTGINRIMAANLDMFFLMSGRAKYDVTILPSGAEQFSLNDLGEGRWGEKNRLLAAVSQNNPRPFGFNVNQPAFPRAGTTFADDDKDQSQGYAGQFGVPTTDVDPISGLPSLANGHPLDNTGVGTRLLAFTSTYTNNEQVANLIADPNNPNAPHRYLQYLNGYSGGAQYQGRFPFPGNTTQLNFNSDSYGMLDEADETMVDRSFISQLAPNGIDSIFSVDEMAALHLSPGDYSQLLLSSRLRQLASLNLEDAPTGNQQARLIRQRFTTESWDRREHGFAYNAFIPPTGTFSRGAWEFAGDWDANSVYNEFPPTVGNNNTAMPPQPPSLTAGNQQPFRNEVAAVIGSKYSFYNVNDPPVTTPTAFPYNVWQRKLRLNINRFLTTANPGNAAFQATVNQASPPIYRQLTPHPNVMLPAGPMPGSAGGAPAPTLYQPANFSIMNPPPPTPPGPQLQEYWARVERQKMARDIYVMLYMFGGGNDALDYRQPNTIVSPGQRQLYYDWQLKEMAQFAVNYVDALDRDDTITKFEYDKNLGDGWGLDDNPYGPPSGDTGAGLNDRGEVFGVEAQTLAFSEALCFNVPSGGIPDNPRTPWDEATVGGDRTWTYVELRNAGANPVTLQDMSNPTAAGQWRIRMCRPGNATVPDTSVILKRNAFDFLNPQLNRIQPGSQYVVSSVGRSVAGFDTVSGSPGTARSSDFRVDINGDGLFDRIVPRTGGNDTAANITADNGDDPGPDAVTDRAPSTNLDLVHNRDATNNSYVILRHNINSTTFTSPSANGAFSQASVPQTGTDVSTLPAEVGTRGQWGGFGANTNPAVPGQPNEPIVFYLERRANLNRSSPTSAQQTDPDTNNDNPWITVDVLMEPLCNTILVSSPPNTPQNPGVQQITIGPTDSGPTILNSLWRLTSIERTRPLDRSGTFPYGGTFNPPAAGLNIRFANTIGSALNSPANTALGGPGGPYMVWQPHFDRDFSSVMELLNVPLYGPDEVTARLAFNGKVLPEANYAGVITPKQAAAPYNYQLNTAHSKFTQPHNTNSSLPAQPAGTPGVYDNRWYRILELLEFPNRSNRQLETALGTLALRVPGKINLNLIRHPEVLMALLDDPNQFNLSLQDVKEVNRDWFQQLLRARDGYDPVVGQVVPGAVVPGSPASRPFRDFSQANGLLSPAAAPPVPILSWSSSIDHTSLRRLPQDNEDLNDNGTAETGEDYQFDTPNTFEKGANGTRRLFEARTFNDLTNNFVDPHTRNRLLAKVSNNSTVRSNVFLIWVTVGFFDTYQPDPTKPNVLQIGAEMTDQPRRRGFFVVDRSLLEVATVPATTNSAGQTIPATFDFRKFIQYRKTIQ